MVFHGSLLLLYVLWVKYWILRPSLHKAKGERIFLWNKEQTCLPSIYKRLVFPNLSFLQAFIPFHLPWSCDLGQEELSQIGWFETTASDMSKLSFLFNPGVPYFLLSFLTLTGEFVILQVGERLIPFKLLGSIDSSPGFLVLTPNTAPPKICLCNGI